ncbi:MAG: hypothetical protein HC866_13790 [Leptolyngbyaceae cyanobacterium RU_5_1]|nr:hypothetical protein [Leptolyngbyaceae cyanobacterium RU_5_1]
MATNMGGYAPTSQQGKRSCIFASLLTKTINECISADDALGWFAHCGLFI